MKANQAQQENAKQHHKSPQFYYRRHLMVYLLLLSPLLVSNTAWADSVGVFESVEYKYYEISPRSAYEIKPELMRRSPIRSGGGSFNGHTDWYINWQFKTTMVPVAPGQFACQLTDIRTKVHVVHTLPKLSRYVRDPQTIDVFNKFSAALKQHELNHGKNGVTAAREINKNLQQIKPQPNCHRLSRVANGLGNEIVQYYTNEDNEYDRVTRNGETEGAVIYQAEQLHSR